MVFGCKWTFLWSRHDEQTKIENNYKSRSGGGQEEESYLGWQTMEVELQTIREWDLFKSSLRLIKPD